MVPLISTEIENDVVELPEPKQSVLETSLEVQKDKEQQMKDRMKMLLKPVIFIPQIDQIYTLNQYENLH